MYGVCVLQSFGAGIIHSKYNNVYKASKELSLDIIQNRREGEQSMRRIFVGNKRARE